MRKIEIEGPITITADEPDEKYGNASHMYECAIDPDEMAVAAYEITRIEFQRGSVKEVGVNGLTNEVLLHIVVDRLRGFQSGLFACHENALALASVEFALSALEMRTLRRVARGVEGTNVK